MTLIASQTVRHVKVIKVAGNDGLVDQELGNVQAYHLRFAVVGRDCASALGESRNERDGDSSTKTEKSIEDPDSNALYKINIRSIVFTERADLHNKASS